MLEWNSIWIIAFFKSNNVRCLTDCEISKYTPSRPILCDEVTKLWKIARTIINMQIFHYVKHCRNEKIYKTFFIKIKKLANVFAAIFLIFVSSKSINGLMFTYWKLWNVLCALWIISFPTGWWNDLGRHSLFGNNSLIWLKIWIFWHQWKFKLIFFCCKF